jgi:hypothetical protein
MSEEQKQPDTKEVSPELREFYCVKCFSSNFINNILQEHLKTVTITLNGLEPAQDETGINWGVLCMGVEENTYSDKHQPHLADFEVIRHKIVVTI